MKLPETIMLGTSTLLRHGRTMQLWNDGSDRLERRNGKWRYDGGRYMAGPEWHDTPEAAYIACLRARRAGLTREYQASIALIDAEIAAVRT